MPSPSCTGSIWQTVMNGIYAKTMELALHDLRACMVADIPFITVCHIDPVQEGEGIPFLHELYERAREEAAARGLSLEFSTIADIADKAG